MKKSEKKQKKQNNRLEFRFALFRFEAKRKILSEKKQKNAKKVEKKLKNSKNSGKKWKKAKK